MNLQDLDLPEELKSRLKELADRPLCTPEALLTLVRRHTRAIEIVSRKRPVQLDVAQSLCHGLEALLGSATAEQLPLVQLAALYFVDSGDDDPDMDSPTGLEDDAQVFAAVARALGRSDLA